MAVLEVLKEFLANSSFHGLRFLGEKERHWTERIFWVLCITLSWIASVLLMLTAWNSFQTNAISFVTDTTYLNWQTKFPSVTVCELSNTDKVEDYVKNEMGFNDSFNQVKIESALKDLIYSSHEGSNIFAECFEPKQPNSLEPPRFLKERCPSENYKQLYIQLSSKCEEVFKQCIWRNEPFDCCKYFLPLETEFGICYSLNNYHTRSSNQTKKNYLDTTSNLTTGPVTLKVEVFIESARAFCTSPEDIPNKNTKDTNTVWLAKLGYKYASYFRVREVDNDPEVREVSIEQRKCRFPEENQILKSFDSYSKGACFTECRMTKQLLLCNCTSHLVPKADPKLHCDIYGIMCLIQNRVAVENLKAANRPDIVGLSCPHCVDSCSDMELNSVYAPPAGTKMKARYFASVQLRLNSMPTERLKRVVVRGKLDLVVSMGGTIGLFVGASLLSFVELFYYFTLRLATNICRPKDAVQDQEAVPVPSQARTKRRPHVVMASVMSRRHVTVHM